MSVGDEPPLVDRQWLTRLVNWHDAELPHLHRMLRYYEGRQPLSYMHPELLGILDERVRQVVINWPRLVVDALGMPRAARRPLDAHCSAIYRPIRGRPLSTRARCGRGGRRGESPAHDSRSLLSVMDRQASLRHRPGRSARA